jgi:acyl-CoA synthetase (AMP-forming)/AMP-acid ligase II
MTLAATPSAGTISAGAISAGATLAGALSAVAKRDTGRGVRLFKEGHEVERISFGELHAEAGRLACGLLERGVVPGERVAIALPTSVDFARAFFGVVAAGAVAVPLPPPLRFASLDVHMRRVTVAMRKSRVKVILSNEMLGSLLAPALAGVGAPGEFRILDILDVAQTASSAAAYSDVAGQDPALVQYTSGTVESPKGVVLTHANVLANVAAITECIGITDDDVSCNWLPMFHDMGLIGSLITSALNGIETCLLPPEDFIKDPGRWLRVISRHRATLTAAPNTGYLHALRRASSELVRELDLSSWRIAFNGAESIDPEIMRKFSDHFAPAGFRPTAFLPVYGLAEGTLAVTSPPPGRPVRSVWVRRDLLGQGVAAFAPAGAEQARELVSVGAPVTGTELRLVADDGTALPDGPAVGEIQVRGASVTRGYEAAGRAGQRHVPDGGVPDGGVPGGRVPGGVPGGGIPDGGWVPTGDLGFRHDGELYVAGRKKEMVIVFGQNHYASDIESAAGRVPGVRPDGVLAASIPAADGEGLVLMVETRETDDQARADLVAQIRQAVSSGLGITPRDVVLVRRGRLPRTSSGKLQRHGSDALYEELQALYTPQANQALADQHGR